MEPYFTIIVPTRDRPHFMKYNLKTLVDFQTFKNFEVIVCDNFIDHTCKEIFDEVADERFIYVKPDTPLSMSENWNLGMENARGKYIIYLEDKLLLYKFALQKAYDILENEDNVDILSWGVDFFSFKDETGGDYSGFIEKTDNHNYMEFDPMEELRNRFNYKDYLGDGNAINSFRGKILFGCYSKRLCAKIIHSVGQLFWPFAPDYTTTVLALNSCERAIDLGYSMALFLRSNLSNGTKSKFYPKINISFLNQSLGIKEFDKAPIPGCYLSLANMVALDYCNMKEKAGGGLIKTLFINKVNLLAWVHTDLEGINWGGYVKEKRKHYKILRECCKTLSKEERECYQEKYKSIRMSRYIYLKMIIRQILGEKLHSFLKKNLRRQTKDILYGDYYQSVINVISKVGDI